MPFVSSVRGNYAAGKRRAGDISSKLAISGGTITTAGGYRIHTFTTAGASTFDTTPFGGGTITVEYLVIGGGGGGGTIGGGGGAGGFVSGSKTQPSGSYAITVAGTTLYGPSSPHGPAGQPGANTTVFGLTARGGGRGGGWGDSDGSVGGSGGGGTGSSSGSVAIQSSQNSGLGTTVNAGHPGAGGGNTGQGGPGAGTHTGGGGGGAGSAGSGRMGGLGLTSSITGSSVGYAGGGGAGSHSGGTNSSVNTTLPAIPSPFGAGRGGSVDYNPQSPYPGNNGEPGSPNTGSGGGGTFYQGTQEHPGDGGSGIVVVRYLI